MVAVVVDLLNVYLWRVTRVGIFEILTVMNPTPPIPPQK